MTELYLCTQMLIDALTAHGVRVLDVESHDVDDLESSDRIWLDRDTSGGMYEGQYLSVERISYIEAERIMYVSYNSSHLCGGDPTHWTKLLVADDIAAIQSLVLEHWPGR